MYNTAYRITANETDAEDVLQEAFINAFQKLDSYREDASFGAWLKRIVINKSLTHVQKNKGNVMAVEEIANYDREVALETEPQYSVNAIKKAMNELPSGFRTVLSLYLFEGYDHGEISNILGISESTSKTQYKRAKDKLRQLLKKEEFNYG